MLKVKKIRSEKHRRFVASLPCVVTGSPDVQCAHIRKNNGGGLGLKPCDSFCVPLSCREHYIQGQIGEEPYWKPYGGIEKATELAKALFSVSGNREAAMEIIFAWRGHGR